MAETAGTVGSGNDRLPVVDVMIPAYGDGRLLRAAVDSVLAQDEPSWRLTVIDDGGGNAGIAPVLAALGDDRIRYLCNRPALGIAGNFQRCLDEATGDLVVILGCDDRLLPDYVGTVSRAARDHPQADWIHPCVRVIDGMGRPVQPMVDRVKRALRPRVRGFALLGGERLAGSLLRGNWMYFPSVAFRRERAQRHGFRPGYAVVLDLDLYLRLLLDGGCGVLLEHTCFEYRRHAGSLSSCEALSGQRFDEEQRYFEQVRAELRSRGWHRAARAAGLHLASRLHALARLPAALRAGDRQLAWRLVVHVAGRAGAAPIAVSNRVSGR